MMDAQLIEKQDRLRYRMIWIRTIGFLLMMGPVLFIPAAKNWEPTFQIILATIAGIGAIIFIYGISRFIFWLNTIKRQPKLKNALYDEMYNMYELRAMAGGFGAFIASSLLLGGTLFGDIPKSTACYAILFCGVMTYQIAQLILHRK